MYRYINLNLNSNPNSLNINKKPQKTKPISLLSGGNSFFVKVKSNQIATNYNDKNNKLKPNFYHKISNNTYIAKENKSIDKSLTKYLNNSQPKVSFLFSMNNTMNQRKLNNNNTSNNKSLINRTKQEIFTHNKGIYSFTSNKINDKLNNKSINQSSLRNNYTEVLVTDFDQVKINLNKIATIPEKGKETKKSIKEKNGNNIINYNNKIYQTKTLNRRSKLNNKIISESKNKNEQKNQEKISNLTEFNKNNNQNKLVKKNQNITKNNNKNVIKYKNISNILFNTNPNVGKIKKNNNNKNTNSEGKNRVIFQVQKKNNKMINYNYSNNIDNNTFTNIIKDNIKELDEYNSGSISKRKNEKKVKTINVISNNEDLRNQAKYNYNTVLHDKNSLLQKKNNDNITNMNQHISTKSNINKNPKFDNILHDYKINFNHALTNITELNSKNLVINENNNLINDNISTIKKSIEINNTKDNKRRNKNNISGLNSLNIDNHRLNNYPNIIINNNYLYNYMPFVTLNNSTIDDNSNRFKLNRNSFIGNNYHTNNTQNLPVDKFLNYSTITDNKILTRENKNLINKKNRIEAEKFRVNINDDESQNNNSINNAYNFHTKFISSNNLENNINKSKTKRTNINLYYYKENNNNHKNITDNYISKEKNKKRKQNPPLNKNPKKLNILSLIQENNRKNKPNIRGKNNISTYINQNKSYNNNNKNDYLTIEQILYPENDKINYTSEKFDNFDDINTIVKRINFENVDLKKNNIFTVENKYTDKNLENNIWYEQFSENFNIIFDKRFENNKQNMSAAQNKIKKTNYVYHSRQSGSTKDSIKENSSSIKKIRVSSYINKRLDNSGIINNNKKI